jgi:glutathione reductase (NADPH)
LSSFDYDLFVIGGGSGGVRAARTSAGLGARVALAEADRLGGTCVNAGCIPKKLLAYASHYRDDFEDAAGYGWTVTPPSFHWRTLVENVFREVGRLNGVYEGLLSRAGVEILRARAELVDLHTIAVAGRKITAETILVATGAQPHVPDVPGRELTITSDGAFALDELPARVVVVGAGYIGVEFASIFRGLGAEVHLVHKDAQILNAFDDDVRTFLCSELRRHGIHVHLGRRVERFERRDDGAVARLDDGSELVADVHLIATGRWPNARGFGLEEIGVELGDRGGIVVDDMLRTTVPNVYALGDVIDRLALTPVALAEAMAFAHGLYGEGPRALDYACVPTAVFSNPNVSTVGLTEQEAWRQREEVTIYRSEFRSLKYTVSGRSDRSLMKIVVCRRTDRVLGFHMVGPDAGEVMQGLAVCLKLGLTKAQLDSTIGIHPTAAEEFVTMREPA